MQTQMAIEEKFTLAVFDLIHENLQPSVASYFGSGPSFSVEEVEGFSFMDAKHWVSWISLGFGHATLCMRIHYKAEEIRSLMATRIHKNVNHIPELLVKDVMGEFLNIFSATFKSEFALLDPRVSVPRCRSGNERERASIHMIDRNSATWEILGEESRFIMSAFLQIDGAIRDWSKPEEGDNVAAGEVDLF